MARRLSSGAVQHLRYIEQQGGQFVFVENNGAKLPTGPVRDSHAVVQYRVLPQKTHGHPVWDMHRTFVPSRYRGQGLAEVIGRGALTAALQENKEAAQGLRVRLSCSYLAKKFGNDDEFSEIVVADVGEEPASKL